MLDKLLSFKSVRLLTLISFFLVIQGCTSTQKVATVEKLETNTGQSKIVVMPLDVELSVLTATGLTEPNAEWTENATAHMKKAINDIIVTRKANATMLDELSGEHDATEIQLEKLHQYVGSNILVHHLGPVKLPSKKTTFDWSLGTDAQTIKTKTGADYALFVFMRDSYASAGRVAMQVGMALLGVGVQGGTQFGFASLVDLNSGDIVWFNRLISTTGDLREEKPAVKTVKELLESLPNA